MKVIGDTLGFNAEACRGRHRILNYTIRMFLALMTLFVALLGVGVYTVKLVIDGAETAANEAKAAAQLSALATAKTDQYRHDSEMRFDSLQEGVKALNIKQDRLNDLVQQMVAVQKRQADDPKPRPGDKL